MAEIEADLPPAVGWAFSSDRSKIYKQRLELLLKNGLIGLVLVLILLGFFLLLLLPLDFYIDEGVVVELKREQGTDQVVGQILRYMGWVKDHYRTDKFRGIIVVGSKDQALSYAIKAVSNVQVKEFRLLIK